MAQKLEAENVRDTVTDVNRVGDDDKGRSQFVCYTCPYKQHRNGQRCPGLSGTCFDCNKDGHFKGAKICKKPKKKEDKKKPIANKKKKGKQPVQRVSDSSENDSSSDSNSSSVGRVKEIVVAKCKDEEKDKMSEAIKVSVRPHKGGQKLLVNWTPDSGVRRTLLSEKDWMFLKGRNKNLKVIRV